MSAKTIALGSDHAGVDLKDDLAGRLRSAGYPVDDLGPHDHERVDYPDFAAAVGLRVAADPDGRLGILVCGTGIGMAIAANKVPGIRAAVVHDPVTAGMAREHNDANVLCLGARLLAADYAWNCVRTWLDARFAGGRHGGRIEKIHRIEGRPVTGADPA